MSDETLRARLLAEERVAAVRCRLAAGDAWFCGLGGASELWRETEEELLRELAGLERELREGDERHTTRGGAV